MISDLSTAPTESPDLRDDWFKASGRMPGSAYTPNPQLLPPPVPAPQPPRIALPPSQANLDMNRGQNMLLDFDAWKTSRAPETAAAVDRILAASPDPDMTKAVLSNQAFMAQKTGTPEGVIARDYDKLRDSYAIQNGWDDAVGNDRKFNARAREVATKDKDEAEMTFGSTADTPEAAEQRKASIFGIAYEFGLQLPAEDDGSYTLKAWQQTVKNLETQPGFKKENVDAYYAVFSNVLKQGQEAGRKADRLAALAYDILKSKRVTEKQVAGEETAIDVVTKVMASQPEDIRELALERLGTKPEFKGKDDENIGVGVGDAIVRGGAWIVDKVDQKLDTFAKSADVAMGDATEADRAKLAQMQALKNRVQGISEGVVYPINKDTIMRKIIIGGAESIPMMAAAAVPGGPVLMGLAYSAESEQKMVAQGTDPATAQALSLISGPAKAAMDMFQVRLFSKFPGMGNLLGQMSGRAWAAGAATFTGIVAGETITELAQDNVVDYAVTKVASLFDDTIYAQPWAEVVWEMKEAVGETALVMLPWAALGVGVATAADVKGAAHLVKDANAMRILGYSQESIDRVQAAPEADAVAVFRQEWSSRTPFTKGDSKASSIAEAADLAAGAQAEAAAANDASIDGSQRAAYAASEADLNKEAGIQGLRLNDNGWSVIEESGNEVPVGTIDAARHLRESLLMARTEAEATAYIQILEGLHEPGKEQEISGALVEAEKGGQLKTTKPTGEVLFEQMDSAGAIATLDAELELAGTDLGIIQGSNMVVDGVTKIMLNQSREGAFTAIHENVEAALKAGRVTKAEVQAAAKVALSLFGSERRQDIKRPMSQDRVAEEQGFAQRLSDIVAGKASATSARETIVELMVANVTSQHKDGTRFKAGALTTALEGAIARNTDPAEKRALGKFRAYLRAVKAYMRALFSTVAKLQKARREGADLEALDALTNKLLRRDESAAHEKAVEEHAAETFSVGKKAKKITGVSKVSDKHDAERVGTALLGTDAKPLPTPQTSNIRGSMVPDELLARQMEAVDYKHLPPEILAETDPHKKRDMLVQWFKTNLLALHDAYGDKVRERATHWYDGARLIAEDFAQRYGISDRQAAGVLAVFSPQKDWFMNVAQAEQAIDIWHNHQKTVISEKLVREQMEAIIDAAVATPKQKRKKKPGESKLATARRRAFNANLDQIEKDKRRVILESLIGKTVASLDKFPVKQGWAIRLLAQSIHGRHFSVISPEGEAMHTSLKADGTPQFNAWGSIGEIEKAVLIMKKDDLGVISDNLGTEHKVRNFYNNIVAPNSPHGDTTIDTHAVAAAHLMPFGASALEVKHDFGSKFPSSGKIGISGSYHIYMDAYALAAAERGIQPRQMQSITWEAIRQVYPPESRRDKAVIAKAYEAWQGGDSNASRTHILRNGIPNTPWAGTDNAGQPDGVAGAVSRRRGRDDTGGSLRFRGGDSTGLATAGIPGGGVATFKPAKGTKVLKAGKATVIGPATFSIGAYHGTPHRVDRFRTERIGSGEGAQAYGWGLYFAENKEVAEYYRSTLADESEDEIQSALQFLSDPEKGISADPMGDYGYSNHSDYVALAEGLGYERKAPKKPGNLYHVELAFDPVELLDWDKPLTEQPEIVAKLKRMRLIHATRHDNMTGRQIYHDLDLRLGDPEAASSALRAAGIRGIKYLDRSSRSIGDGSRNIVAFSEDDIRITAGGEPATFESAAQSFSVGSAYVAKLDEHLSKGVAEANAAYESITEESSLRDLDDANLEAGLALFDKIPLPDGWGYARRGEWAPSGQSAALKGSVKSSWYATVESETLTDEDGEPVNLKLSIRDHEQHSRSHESPDIEALVDGSGAVWAPEDAAAAIRRVMEKLVARSEGAQSYSVGRKDGESFDDFLARLDERNAPAAATGEVSGKIIATDNNGVWFNVIAPGHPKNNTTSIAPVGTTADEIDEMARQVVDHYDEQETFSVGKLGDLQRRFAERLDAAASNQKAAGEWVAARKEAMLAPYAGQQLDGPVARWAEDTVNEIENAVRMGRASKKMLTNIRPGLDYRESMAPFNLPVTDARRIGGMRSTNDTLEEHPKHPAQDLAEKVGKRMEEILAPLVEELDFTTREERSGELGSVTRSEDSAITYSLGSAGMIESLAEDIARRLRGPGPRLDAYMRIHDDLAGMARAVAHNDSVADAMRSAALEAKQTKESKALAARHEAAEDALRIEQEFETGAARDEKWTRQQKESLAERHGRARAALSAKQREEVTEMRGRHTTAMARVNAADKRDDDKTAMMRALAALDTMLIPAPPEVREKVGGFLALAAVKTNESRQRELLRRIERMDAAWEEFLREDITAKILKAVKQASPAREPGEKPKGKLGAAGHAMVDSVAEAIGLTVDEAEARIDAISNQMAVETDPAVLADLGERLNIVSRFGALETADINAEALHGSLRWLAENISRERSIWRMQEEARLAEVRELTAEGVESIGAADMADSMNAGSEGSSGMTATRAAVSSIPGAIRAIFGKDSAVTKRWRRRLRQAVNGMLDDAAAMEREFHGMVRTHFGAGMPGWRRFYDMFQVKAPSGVKVISGGEQKTISVPSQTARNILDGKAPALAAAYDKQALEAMRAALDANDARGKDPADRRSPLTDITFDTLTGGVEKELNLTRAEAIRLSLMWGQEQGRGPMEAHGFTADGMKRLEAYLTPEARAFRDWVLRHYREEWGPLNAVFSRMQGVALPQIANYAPLSFKAAGKLDTGGLDPFSGAAMDPGGMQMGMFKSRREKHKAEPALGDEFATFFRHIKQTSYFRHFGEIVREMRNVLGSVAIQNAIATKHGRHGTELAKKVLEVMDKGGSIAKQGTEDRRINEMAGARALASLSANPGTLLKQASAAVNLVHRMPAGEFLRRLPRLFAGLLNVGAMRRSQTIQRRPAAGSNPEMQQALSYLDAKRPTRLRYLAHLGLVPMQHADAFWTAAGAAIYHDWQKAKIRAENPTMPAGDVEREATQRLEEELGDTAQPISFLDKSIAELERGALARLAFMFQSESRQKVALQIEAGGEKDWSTLTKSIVVNGLVGVMMQGIAAVWRDMRDDDDDEWFDAEHWSAMDFVIAATLGQWGAMPVFWGIMIEGFAQSVKGVNFDNSLASDMKKAAGAVESMFRTVTAEDKQGELKAKEPAEKLMHSAVGLAEAASVLLGAGEYGTAVRTGGYFFDFLDTLHDDEVETEQKEKRKDRRLIKEAREGGE